MFSQSLKKNIINTFVYQILSKGLGYVKYLIFAVAFGMSYQMDAYSMALTVLEVSLIIVGHVFTSVGVPQLVKAKQKSLISFKKLSGSIFLFSLLITAILVPLQYIYFENIVSLFAPGFDIDKLYKTKEIFNYFIIMSIVYLPFFALSSFFRALNLFNISNLLEFIVSIVSFLYLLLALDDGVYIIPLSLSIGYLIAMLVALYYARKIRIIGFIGNLYNKELLSLYKNTVKLFSWLLVNQLYKVIDKGFASLLESGMIIALTYSSMILSGIGFIFDFATVYLTKFSEDIDKGALFTKALKLYITISIPIIIFLIFYSYEVINLIYGYGKFDIKAIETTSLLVSLFSPLLFLGLANGLFQSLYISLNKYGYMIFLTTVGVGVNFLLNSYLVEEYKIYGIAISTTIATSLIFILNLFWIKYKEDINIKYLELIKYFFLILLVSVFSYFFTYFLNNFILISIVFFNIYIFILFILKDEFIIRIVNSIRSRFFNV